MDENPTTSASQPVVSSAMTRMSNVFIAPSELYSEVAVAPAQTSSWLLPFLISIILAVVATYAVFNNPSLRQQVYDMQEKAMQKMVAEGKVSQDRMDQQMEGMKNSGPAMFVTFGAGLQIISFCLIFFLGALLLWLAAKFVLKFSGSYSKILEIYGLASWIGILGTIVAIILMNLMNNMFASPGGGMILGDSFDPLNKGHKLLASLNIFTLWEMAVLGLGLAKASGKSTGLGMGISFALWAIFMVGLTMLF